jgi:hypothetical protein
MILINLFLTSACIYILIYIENFYNYLFFLRQNSGERGGEIGSGTALQAGRPRVPFPMGVSAIFFYLHNISSCPVVLVLTLHLTQMNTKKYFLGIKAAGV